MATYSLHKRSLSIVTLHNVTMSIYHPNGPIILAHMQNVPSCAGGGIHGTTSGTKDLRTLSHWILALIMIYYYLINQ